MPDQPTTTRRLCAACKFLVPGYVGIQTWGFCTFRETMNSLRLPRVNGGQHFKISGDGRLLETRWDCSCPQFEDRHK